MKRTSQRPALVTATLVLFAIIATGCGAVVTASEQREAVIDIGPAPEPAPALAPEPAPTPEPGPALATEPAPAAPAERGGHQYGSTLAEWQGDTSAETISYGELGYPEIQWEDLIPVGASGAELIARFEEQLNAVEPGTQEAEELYEEIRAEYNPEAVNTELDGQQIRMAGFVAPLTYEDDVITEFLFVPTFGACIHVPPPPPNQTIMVSVDKEDGLSIDDSWGAVWVEGTMILESATSDLGATSYRITEAVTGPYNSF